MAKVISLVNQKGGVGKTTTSINLAAALGKEGKKTLLIDLDPQGNASNGLGLNNNDFEHDIYDVITGACNIKEAIIKTKFKNLSIIPATINLAGVDVEFIRKMYEDTTFHQNEQLRMYLEEIKDKYDYIFIDCPPSLGLITLNSFTAADSVLIPVQCEYYALEGLGQLINTINLVKKHLNKSLEIEGAVLTMYDIRTNLSNQVVKEVKKYFDDKVYKTVIPRNVRLSEAPSFGMPITTYDPKSKGARSYEKLAKEFLKAEDAKEKAKHMK